MEIFGKVSVLHARKLPPAEHLLRLRGVAAQAILALVTGGDRIDGHSVSLPEPLDRAAQCVNDSDGFMAQSEVGALSDRPWTSDVQTSAAVVLTIASFGPGSAMGFSIIPTEPIFFMTNVFMV